MIKGLIILVPTLAACGTKNKNDDKELKKAREDLQQVSLEKANLEESLKESQMTKDERGQDLKQKNILLEEKAAALEQQLALLSKEQTTLKEQLTSTNQEKDTLATELGLKQKTIDSINGEIEAKEKEAAEVKSQLAKLSGDLAETEKARAKLTSTLKNLETDLKNFKAKLEAADKEKSTFKKEIEAKISKIEELNKKIDSLTVTMSGVANDQALVAVRTLDPMVGIYRTSDKLPNSDCYKLVDIKADGSVILAVTCANGQLEIQKSKVLYFEAQAVTRSFAKYGMAVKIGQFESPCGMSPSFEGIDQVMMQATNFDNAVIPFEYASMDQDGEMVFLETVAFGFISPSPTLELAKKMAEGYNNLAPYAAVVTYLEKAGDPTKQGCFDKSLGFKPLIP